jgi:hypothetical protein
MKKGLQREREREGNKEREGERERVQFSFQRGPKLSGEFPDIRYCIRPIVQEQEFHF